MASTILYGLMYLTSLPFASLFTYKPQVPYCAGQELAIPSHTLMCTVTNNLNVSVMDCIAETSLSGSLFPCHDITLCRILIIMVDSPCTLEGDGLGVFLRSQQHTVCAYVFLCMQQEGTMHDVSAGIHT